MKNLKEIIADAERRRIAIGHFNIVNLEQLNAIARVGMRLNVPIIIGVSEGERAYLGARHARDFVDSYNKEHGKEDGFWFFLNADHTRSLEKAKEAAENGFDAVLFDGGKLPMEENIAKTKEAVAAVKRIHKGVLVEGELGYIGSSSEVWKKIPEGAAVKSEDMTTPEDAARFAKETGVDLLAPAVGNFHGMFASAPNPRLDIPRIRAIRDAAGVPLVLHGGSGIVDKDFVAAMDAGVSIIHISTELRVAWRKSLEEELAEHPGEVAPYKVMPDVLKAMEEVAERHLRLFNRIG
jgi:fructose-bisphosphate aldolase class II